MAKGLPAQLIMINQCVQNAHVRGATTTHALPHTHTEIHTHTMACRNVTQFTATTWLKFAFERPPKVFHPQVFEHNPTGIRIARPLVRLLLFLRITVTVIFLRFSLSFCVNKRPQSCLRQGAHPQTFKKKTRTQAIGNSNGLRGSFSFRAIHSFNLRDTPYWASDEESPPPSPAILLVIYIADSETCLRKKVLRSNRKYS